MNIALQPQHVEAILSALQETLENVDPDIFKDGFNGEELASYNYLTHNQYLVYKTMKQFVALQENDNLCDASNQDFYFPTLNDFVVAQRIPVIEGHREMMLKEIVFPDEIQEKLTNKFNENVDNVDSITKELDETIIAPYLTELNLDCASYIYFGEFEEESNQYKKVAGIALYFPTKIN